MLLNLSFTVLPETNEGQPELMTHKPNMHSVVSEWEGNRNGPSSPKLECSMTFHTRVSACSLPSSTVIVPKLTVKPMLSNRDSVRGSGDIVVAKKCFLVIKGGEGANLSIATYLSAACRAE